MPSDTGLDKQFEAGHRGLHKRQVYPGDCGGANLELFQFFNSAPMLQFLEGLTTIQSLVADPYFEGGGFHEISVGGKLGVHADFRVNERLHLQCRLNVLIYLNKLAAGVAGELEIWDRQMNAKVRSVVPLFQPMCRLQHRRDLLPRPPKPARLPAGRETQVYYYTASPRIYEDISAATTDYHARPADDGQVRAEARRLRTFNLLKDWLPPVASTRRAGRRTCRGGVAMGPRPPRRRIHGKAQATFRLGESVIWSISALRQGAVDRPLPVSAKPGLPAGNSDMHIADAPQVALSLGSRGLDGGARRPPIYARKVPADRD